jgi:hypothetical protein
LLDDFLKVCAETKKLITSFQTHSLVPYKATSHFVGYFFFDKFAMKCNFTPEKKIKNQKQSSDI